MKITCKTLQWAIFLEIIGDVFQSGTPAARLEVVQHCIHGPWSHSLTRTNAENNKILIPKTCMMGDLKKGICIQSY